VGLYEALVLSAGYEIRWEACFLNVSSILRLCTITLSTSESAPTWEKACTAEYENNRKKGERGSLFLPYLHKILYDPYVGIIQIRFTGRKIHFPLSLLMQAPLFLFTSLLYAFVTILSTPIFKIPEAALTPC